MRTSKLVRIMQVRDALTRHVMHPVASDLICSFRV